MPTGRQVDVAVVLVDTDEHPVKASTVDAVQASAAGIEVTTVIVDARRRNGPAYAADERVRVVRPAARSGATSMRLLGAAETSAPVLAFLDAHALPRPDWLQKSLRALSEDSSVGAVTAAVRSVGEPTLSYTANVGAHHPVDDRDQHRVLFPLPEAALFRRSVIDAVGGFMPELSWPCAVVDLGWRLNLGGHQVVLNPEVRVAAQCSCEPEAFSGLVVLHGCLDDAALGATLPAALLVAAAKDGGTSFPRSAVDRFIVAGPMLDERRAFIQRTRVESDDALLDMLVAPLEPARGDEQLADVYVDAARRHELANHFHSRQRIVVVTPDVLTPRMAGPAIRAWQISSALAPRHLVHLVSTADRCELTSTRFAVSAPDEAQLEVIARDADVVIVQGFAMEGRPYLRADDKKVVVDLYDPLHLEQLEQFKDAPEQMRRVTVREATRVLNEQLVRGDFFMCASDKQRDFWLGQLAALGRINHVVYDEDTRLVQLLDVVPFGLPDEAPSSTARAMKGVVPGIGIGDEVILWGGGIYNWFDPLTLIRAVDRLKERRPSVRLFFMGLRHPNPGVAEMRIATESRRLAKELELTNRFVFFNEGWVTYDERQNFLLEADVGVSTHFDHVETQFSFRTRILDYLWTNLPIVATEGDWFADLIAREGLGIVVPAEDVTALEEALHRVLGDTEFALECRRRLEKLRPSFAWSRALAPLLAFCRSPRRAADLLQADVREDLWKPAYLGVESKAAGPPARRRAWRPRLDSRSDEARRIP